MEINVDGRWVHVPLAYIVLLGLIILFYILFIFKYNTQIFAKIHNYIENKYNVKIISKFRHINIEGDISRKKKIQIELHYLLLIFLASFGPILLAGLLVWGISQSIK